MQDNGLTAGAVTSVVRAARAQALSGVPRGWLKALLTPWSRRAALLAFVGTFVFPVGGLGVDLCPLHAATGLPCPGCGVTRGLSALSQGDWHLALGANPFVVMVWPALALLGLLAFVPQASVDRLEQRLDTIEPFFSRAFRVVLAAFFGFGVLRLGWVLVSREWFP